MSEHTDLRLNEEELEVMRLAGHKVELQGAVTYLIDDRYIVNAHAQTIHDTKTDKKVDMNPGEIRKFMESL